MMHGTRSSNLKKHNQNETRLSQMVFRMKLRDEDSYKVTKGPVKRVGRPKINDVALAPKAPVLYNNTNMSVGESTLDLAESMLISDSDTTSMRTTLRVPERCGIFSPLQLRSKQSVETTKAKPAEKSNRQKPTNGILKSKPSKKGPIATSTPVPLPVKTHKRKHKHLKCKLCNAKFKFSSILKFHLERHDFLEKTNSKEERSRHKQTLQQEAISANPIRRNPLVSRSPSKFMFKCRICSKCFCSKYNLLCHRFTHVGKTKKASPSLRSYQDIKIKEILIHNIQFRQEGLNEGDLPFCSICKMSYPSDNENAIEPSQNHEIQKKKSVPTSNLDLLKPTTPSWMQHILPVNKRLFCRDD